MLQLEDNLGLIRKITWGYVKGNPGLEFDELFAEACLACLEAGQAYNPLKGKETTFIYRVVNNRLRSLIGREGIREGKEIISNYRAWPSPEEEVIAREEWQNLLSSLSPNALKVCSLVLDEPSPYLQTDKPKLCRGIITRELRRAGWGWSDIWNSFREIKQAVSM